MFLLNRLDQGIRVHECYLTCGFDEMVNTLEECRVSPAPGAVGEQSLPLTFSDLMWTHIHQVENLFFYRFSHSTTHFIDSTIPALKHSLSLALNYYYPFAGNLRLPLNHKEPDIHYKDGDSVLLTFVESDDDFDYLINDHQKEAARFHPFIPRLPPVSEQDGTLVAPVLAAKVTLFPGAGICLGLTMNHVVADASTFIRFVKLWATIHKSQAEPTVLDSALLPSYDRTTMVQQTKTLASNIWQHQKNIKFEGSRPLHPTSNILATFVLKEADLLRLKKRVKAQRPSLSHVSSFTVACAYIWACVVKSRVECGEKGGEMEFEWLGFTAECRSYLDPPLPDNYFGNCIIPCTIFAKTEDLVSHDGLIHAAYVMGEKIRQSLRSEEGVVGGLGKLLPTGPSAALPRGRVVGITGSPKFDAYNIDFGFGQLQKREYIAIDQTRAVSVIRGKDNERDIEVGLSFSKTRMDAFASIFSNGLVVED